MSNQYQRIQIEVGQIWECRTPRRDGTRERVHVLAVNGRSAKIRSENPRPPLKAERSIGLLAGHDGYDIGNMRVAVLSDGRRVHYPRTGGAQIEASP